MRRHHPHALLLLLAGVRGGCARGGAAVPPLPRLGIDPSLVSVGGISSGADFAAHFMLAHSAG
eukprot:gene3487-8261_t